MRTSKYIPGAGRKPLWKKKWILELSGSVPPVILAIAAGIRASKDMSTEIVILAAVAVMWMLLAMIWRIAAANSDDKSEEPDVVHEGLHASVSMLHTVLVNYCKRKGYGNDIRATFHRVVPPLKAPTQLEQIIPYVGWGQGMVGRYFSINTGITGHAIRNLSPTIMSSAAVSEDEYRYELIKEWGYTKEQAWGLTSGRFSAVAIPVLDPSRHHAIGVLYLDSSEQDLFDQEDVNQILGVGSNAISDFVTMRYTS